MLKMSSWMCAKNGEMPRYACRNNGERLGNCCLYNGKCQLLSCVKWEMPSDGCVLYNFNGLCVSLYKCCSLSHVWLKSLTSSSSSTAASTFQYILWQVVTAGKPYWLSGGQPHHPLVGGGQGAAHPLCAADQQSWYLSHTMKCQPIPSSCKGGPHPRHPLAFPTSPPAPSPTCPP